MSPARLPVPRAQCRERLDPQRLLYFAAEEQRIAERLEEAFLQVRAGECAKLRAIHEDAVSRTREQEAFVRKFVGADGYQVDTSAEIVLDPEKRGWPKDSEQRDGWLRALLHFQASNFLSSGEPLAEATQRIVHRYELRTARMAKLEVKLSGAAAAAPARSYEKKPLLEWQPNAAAVEGKASAVTPPVRILARRPWFIKGGEIRSGQASGFHLIGQILVPVALMIEFDQTQELAVWTGTNPDQVIVELRSFGKTAFDLITQIAFGRNNKGTEVTA